ncbi:MspA family porin [Tsukamurella soli]|uniref:MspA protein n=1 Tax=Tsukamurella soli TaxID=644556 RepID=A0ABP8KDE7_9ACTN
MKKSILRGAAVVAAVGAAFGALSSGAANADTYIPLPDGRVVQPLPGGGSIVVTITHQSAKLSPGMVALPTSRNAWVSGVIRAQINGPTPGNGAFESGFIVGCQVAVDSVGFGISGSGGATAPISTTPSATVSANGSGSGGSLSLSTGGIGYEWLTLAKPTWPKPGAAFKPDVSNDQGFEKPNRWSSFTGDSGSVAFSDATIGVDGCAGYAQARFFTYVTGDVATSNGSSEGTATLWGKPFTLG